MTPLAAHLTGTPHLPHGAPPGPPISALLGLLAFLAVGFVLVALLEEWRERRRRIRVLHKTAQRWDTPEHRSSWPACECGHEERLHGPYPGLGFPTTSCVLHSCACREYRRPDWRGVDVGPRPRGRA